MRDRSEPMSFLPRGWSHALMNRIAIPRDLDAVTRIDHDAECDPRATGMAPRHAAAIWEAVRALYRTGYYPAVIFSLRYRGHLVFSRAIGHAGGNAPGADPDAPKRIALPHTPSSIFSASKAPTAMVIHRMHEHGDLDLRNPIAYYVPEFGRKGKDRITIADLLSHRAGIPRIGNVDDPRIVLDHEYCLERLCDASPQPLYRNRPAYHAVTGGVILAEIVQRVAGMDVRAAWRKWFKEPMGFRVFDYGASTAVRERLAEQALTGLQGLGLVDDFGRRLIGARFADVIDMIETPDFYRTVIPSANMVATVDEMTAFYQMLMDGGIWKGRRILQPRTVATATAASGPLARDALIGIPMRYSQGFMLGAAPIGLFGMRSERAFGHIGLSNNIAWADPDRRLSAALLVSGIPIVSTSMPALVRLIGRIGTACSRVLQ